MKITYKDSGVDIRKAELFTKKISLSNKGGIGAFASPFNLSPLLKRYKNPLLVSTADGVGTKLKVAHYLGRHCSVGIDLVAMNVNDIVCLGAKPLFFLDYIAFSKFKFSALRGVIRGIHQGLGEADCLLQGGETAQMPGMYRRGEYDLAGFCVGIVDKSKVIDGRAIKAGDVIIGLSSRGLHSNGFSLVRKVLGKKEMRKYACELLKPTRIYVKPILSLLAARCSLQSSVKGIAHITGGAFYNKATKILPKGYGLALEKKSWPTPGIFKIIQEKAQADDREMYSVFNMGLGMILVVKKEYASKAIKHLNRFFPSYVVGEVIKAKQRMVLL